MTQEKRNRNLLISLIVLLTITIGYWVSTQFKNSAADADLFQVEDLTLIDRVTFEKGDQQIELRFDGIRWKIDEEQADQGLVDVLFATLKQAKPLRPVARTLQDTVQSFLRSDGIKVSLFAETKTELTFLAGGNSRKSQSYFQKENDPAYIMTIPGYRVYVSGIFELDKFGWKDKHVFQLNWRNFQGLESRSSGSSKDDFDVKFMDGFFSIDGMAAVDTTKLNDYLDAVSLLTVDEYALNQKMTDSLLNLPPVLRILVSDVAGKEHTLELYYSPSATGTITGIINSTQLAFFNRKRLEPILKKRAYFTMLQ